jgi:hypothetical protein
MSTRHWLLVGVFLALGVTYVTLFTEWLRPAPIEVASQVRFSTQPPRFGRPPKKLSTTVSVGHTNQVNQVVRIDPLERIGQPDQGTIEQAPGGVANVTFSLDGIYQLTLIRVEDVPTDGTPPKILWHLVGRSRPLNSFLYGRNPEGMKPIVPSATFEPLQAGVPYCLIIQAGRRRGTNRFTTIALTPPQ